jgi:uncharacterized membrane protein
MRGVYLASCAAVVWLGLGLRLFHLGTQSLWIDEINVTRMARSGHALSAIRDVGGPFEPPLHILAVVVALKLPFGFESAARIPAALFGTLEVLGLILFAREATGRRLVAVIAGALLAVAPFAVRYSQENRYYTMFSALHLFTWWLLLRTLRRQSIGRWLAWSRGDRRRRETFRRRSIRSWLVYGAVVGAMVLTHPFAPLVLLAQAGVVLVAVLRVGDRDRAFARSLAVGYLKGAGLAALLVLPWYSYGAARWLHDAGQGKSFAINPPGVIKVPVGLDLFKGTAEWLLGNAPVITPLIAVLLIGIIAAPFVCRGRERLVAVCAVVYVLGFVLVLVPLARMMGTYFAFRRIESLAPALLLLVALAIVGAGDRLRSARVDRRIVFAAVATGTAFVLALSSVATAKYYRSQKTNYRAFAAAVSTVSDNSLVVVGPVDARWVPSIEQYLVWRHVTKPVTFMVAGEPPPRLRVPTGGVLWLTGAPPEVPGLHTRSLNDLGRMQIISGITRSRSSSNYVLPWFVSSSYPTTQSELNQEQARVARLPDLLSAST